MESFEKSDLTMVMSIFSMPSEVPKEVLLVPFLSNSPHQNGVLERKNRRIQEMALTVLSQSDIPLSFWGEVVHTAAYIINCYPTNAVTEMTI